MEKDEISAGASNCADPAQARGGETEKSQKPIVLVGLMGAGKSSVGKRLASVLGLPFHDSDDEIVKAAGQTIQEIFDTHGEEEFRRGERRVIERLLDSGSMVLATGGGAFMNAETRALLKEKAVTVWLRADLDLLWRRVGRKGGRPLLQTENPKKVLSDLLDARYPIYAEADHVVESKDGPHMETVNAIRNVLNL